MRIDDVIGDAKTVGISGHIRPDGDCIGSCMGMYLYLRKSYPQIRVDVFLQEIPEIYKFIKDSDQIRSDYETDVDKTLIEEIFRGTGMMEDLTAQTLSEFAQQSDITTTTITSASGSDDSQNWIEVFSFFEKRKHLNI